MMKESPKPVILPLLPRKGTDDTVCGFLNPNIGSKKSRELVVRMYHNWKINEDCRAAMVNEDMPLADRIGKAVTFGQVKNVLDHWDFTRFLESSHKGQC